jgi:hypothetical protein
MRRPHFASLVIAAMTAASHGRAHPVPKPQVCRTPDVDALDLHDRLVRIATADEPGPAKMRAALGVTSTPLTPPDSILLSADGETCRRAGEAYAKVFGSAPDGRGVFVMRFGAFLVVARPDGHPGPMVVVLDQAFERRAVWGLQPPLHSPNGTPRKHSAAHGRWRRSDHSAPSSPARRAAGCLTAISATTDGPGRHCRSIVESVHV